MFPRLTRKTAFGLGLAAALFASGYAMANEWEGQYQPNRTTFYSNPHDDGSSLLDHIQRTQTIRPPAVF